MITEKNASPAEIEAFHDGYNASLFGLPATTCPLAIGSHLMDAWLQGHVTATDETKAMLLKDGFSEYSIN